MLRSEDTVRHSTETFLDTLLLFKPEALIDLAPQLGTKKDGNTGLALLHRLVVLENPVRLTQCCGIAVLWEDSKIGGIN